MKSLQDRIADLDITFMVHANGRTKDEDGWEHDAYTVTLFREDRTMTVPFKMGTGHNGVPPKIEDVVDALASDASTLDDAGDSFDWAESLGYEPYTRKVENLYRAVVKQTDDLRKLVGDDDAFMALLYDTERL